MIQPEDMKSQRRGVIDRGLGSMAERQPRVYLGLALLVTASPACTNTAAPKPISSATVASDGGSRANTAGAVMGRLVAVG